MKTLLISRVVLFLLASSLSSECFAQELTHDDDLHYYNSHVSGVGTTQVGYQLETNQRISDVEALKQYLLRINGVHAVHVTSAGIQVTTNTPWDAVSSYYMFQGVETYYIYQVEPLLNGQ